MNRREAIALPFGLAVAAWLPKHRTRRLPLLAGIPAKDFDPFFVWRESARFGREVLAPMQQRLGVAMAEKIDREWGIA